jgi:hypothetical protein
VHSPYCEEQQCRAKAGLSVPNAPFRPAISRSVPFGAELKVSEAIDKQEIFGAGDGNRTHDIQLGKLTFYL